MNKCQYCGSENLKKKGIRVKKETGEKYQRWWCADCGRFTSGLRFLPGGDKKSKNEIAEKNEDFIYEENENLASLKTNNFESASEDNAIILEEFLKHCRVNLKKWAVAGFVIKAHQVSAKYRDQDLTWKENECENSKNQVMVGHAIRKNEWIRITNYAIQVRLKPRVDFLEQGIEQFIKKIPKFKFTVFTPTNKPGTGIALEMATLDAHFGKLAWLLETGYRNYDLKISVADYEYATEKNLNWASYHKPEKIFYIIGQDLFHIDNIAGHTTHGDHQLDVDGRFPKIYEAAFTVSTKAIYMCRSVAPVKIIWIPGNHDYIASMTLCYLLAEHFRNDKFVQVDMWNEKGKITRKAELWGNLLVGWTHRIINRQETWANELAQAFPDLWGKSVFREWHYGDQHKKKTTKILPEFTAGGVVCRQLTALSTVDSWHFENVFTDAVPGGEAFLWSKDRGIFSNLIAWTSQYEGIRNSLVQKKGQGFKALIQ